MLDKDSLFAWCALWRAPGIGVKRFHRILEVFGSPKAFFSLSISEQQKYGLKATKDQLVLAQKEAEKDIFWLEETADASIITFADTNYPDRLKSIADPSPMLFVRGDVLLLNMPQLAIVGSRSPSYEGCENALNFASFMAKNGVIITSGMALGIDAKAHLGALSQGETIAVMGTGPDRIYPAKNKQLAHDISQKGVIVTEFPVGSPVRPESFPRRNRIISGLSVGVLVVEASIKSGSLITAKMAAEQGREVFAVPGSIHNPLSKGCNYLIKNGAKLVESGADIFEEIKPQLLSFVHEKTDKIIEKKESTISKSEPNLLDDDAKKIWDVLDYSPQPIDELAKRSMLKIEEISSTLLILELEGLVRKKDGLYYKAGQN